ncbi:hypothetical protein BKA62DRAFT_611345 [Auriculariales sp. MPI-PUGE-AT-0066]|nr:hypothetical protein BKA62DRAFT_611345 [Auriculariales sp. MPI-PUGE-AT-0066]
MSAHSRSQSPSVAHSPSPKPTQEQADSRADSPAADDDNETESATPDQPVASTSTSAAPAEGEAPAAHEWQAVWSPPHNAYYFFNTRTQETTWVNPLAPPASESAQPDQSVALTFADSALQPVASSSATLAEGHDAYSAAVAAGIDPELAYLDPTLALPQMPGGGPMSFAAKFNSRTGAFTAASARAPEHLNEFERAKRMSEMYFDVGKWESETVSRQDELKERKKYRPSKAELVSCSCGSRACASKQAMLTGIQRCD